MARKWIFSCFLVVGTLRSVQTASINMEQHQTTTMDNLTAIEWAHAVNSQKELNDALNSSVNMIEADIVLGTLVNDTSGMVMPVMGHPPKTTSDISLDQFLRQILEYNNNNVDKTKGVKLDFKSTQVFTGSLNILTGLWKKMNYPIWLNADILQGPVNETATTPVDPRDFLTGCKQFESAILSIGWTTRWGHNYTEGNYSDNNVNEMLDVIGNNSIRKSGHKITFPVRAGIAAQSITQLQNLYNGLNSTNSVTLTIWSSKGDNVDIEKLRNLIFSFGLDKVYLDVPEEVSSRLHLGNPISPRSSGASNLSSSLINFSIISLAMFVTSVIFQRAQF